MDELDLWTRVAEAVLACPAASQDALTQGLLALGVSDDTRAGLLTVAQAADPEASLLRRFAEEAATAVALEYAVPPRWPDDAIDRAIAAGAALGASPGAARLGPDDLAALPPNDAGQLVTALVAAGATDVLSWVVRSTSPQRYPAALLVKAATAMTSPDLVSAVALIPDVLVLNGILTALADPDVDKVLLAGVLAEIALRRRALVAAGAYQWWRDEDASLGSGNETTTREPTPHVADEPDGDEERMWRGGAEEPGRKSFPRLDLDTRTSRPDVVVVDQEFEVTLGIQQRKDAALVASAPVTFAAGEVIALDVVLLHDPASIEVVGSPRASITVSDATPFPSVTMTCTARYGEDLGTRRRLGLQIIRANQVIALAWRTLTAVDSEQQVGTAPVMTHREAALLDLDPLVGEDAPDLVISVCRGDSDPSWVWTVFAVDASIVVTDLPSTTTLEGDIAGFALETRRAIAFSADPAKDFLGLAGRARRIGKAVPTVIQDAIRAVAASTGRTEAPFALLLTEELNVPWELACLDPELATDWGGASPFLGAHVAISRWPLSEHKPRPRPPATVTVRSGAVLTADYSGVPGWGRLDAAVAEAAQVAALFEPPAATIAPDLWTVIDLLRGLPTPADVLHLALHGQFDAAGDQEGIVLLTTNSTTGAPAAQFLTPAEIENGSLDHAPLVFLNACQVGADERVLGDYAGFASTLLRIGAAAVVAPLWNVRDDVASVVARTFYAATLTSTEPVSIAEAMRAVRATYTEGAVRAGSADLHATLVAYQVFGHPRLRLRKPGVSPPD